MSSHLLRHFRHQLANPNSLLQFFGGAFAIATGQSGGREGPAIHLGSAALSPERARQPLAELHIQATLREALTKMDNNHVDALYISDHRAGPYRDHGIITRSDIERHYKMPILL